MRILPFVLALWSGAAAAHAVHHDITATGAVSISLTYADGSAFAYEKYELYADGKEVPVQVGNTDAAGRVTFIPGETRNWRIKAYSADGHGVDLRFESPALQAGPATTADAGPGRATLALLGLGLILASFGAYQLFLGRKSK
jgi:nickel transport protein